MEGWAAVNRMVREGESWSGHERNNLYVNRQAGVFSDVSGVSGVDFVLLSAQRQRRNQQYQQT